MLLLLGNEIRRTNAIERGVLPLLLLVDIVTTNMKTDIPRNEVLHKARLRAGLTQNQLALSVGVPEFIVTKLETKRRKLDSGIAEKLSSVLKVSVKDLEGGSEL